MPTISIVKCRHLLLLSFCIAHFMRTCIGDEAGLEEEPQGDDYCVSETFQPRCMKHEVVFIKSATYGRMRIGRCITAAEIETLRSHYIGCSTNILSLIDSKCFGKTECEIRVAEISVENIRPCPPGLNVYLEVSYECINIVDERRSCGVDASTNPVHIISSTSCGTSNQPWIVEAPVGQKISIGILEFHETDAEQTRRSCHNRGLIVDKAGKRNESICVGGTRRSQEFFRSAGNSVQIFLNQTISSERTGNDRQFILRLQAVGCSNIIPPVDGYAKRNGDAIMIGCYASRKTWHLNCEDGKWVGVIGNCSQGAVLLDPVAMPTPEASAGNEQVLIFCIIGGFTLAVCLAIVCFGVVCLRRFRVKGNVKQEYKTFDYNISSTRSQPGDLTAVRNLVTHGITGNDVNGINNAQQMPTYSVFVEDGQYNDVPPNSVA